MLGASLRNKAVSIRDTTSYKKKKKKTFFFLFIKYQRRQFFFHKIVMDLGVFLDFLVLIYFVFVFTFMASMLTVTSVVQSAMDPITWIKVDISCHIPGKFNVTSIPCPGLDAMANKAL